MKEELISLFIDDELDVDGKTDFVETIHADPVFAKETLDFLRQEKLLITPQPINLPMPHVSSLRRLWSFDWPFKALSAGLSAAMICLVLLWPTSQPPKILHRFVIYEPGVERAEIVGSFSRWKPLSMKSPGRNGYWEVSIELPPGEYEYSYFLDGNKSVADPTVQFREEDDFGNSNSIIRIGT